MINLFYFYFFRLFIFYVRYVKIVWSDESMIRLVISGNGKVYRKAGEVFSGDCVVKNVKHPLQVMIFGSICSLGLGKLYFVEDHMNSIQYVKVIDDVVVPQLKKWFGKPGQGRRKFYFMQDSAPCHTSKLSMARLAFHKLNVLPWPSNSPDMNPIENVWAVLKQEVRLRIQEVRGKNVGQLRDIDILKDAITHCWENNERVKRTAINACKAMDRRIKTLWDNRGKWTKY